LSLAAGLGTSASAGFLMRDGNDGLGMFSTFGFEDVFSLTLPEFKSSC
jgi:hypothetical protein